ncbi:MAG: hypothetical protein KAS07_04575 [Candidatus Pacebacteria bacterium]|nr:hypothetical protein [Candidatus Paceibacterota bacterium]
MLNFENTTTPLRIKVLHDKHCIADGYKIVEKVAEVFMKKFAGLGLFPIERNNWLLPSGTKLAEAQLLKNLRKHCSPKYLFVVFFTQKEYSFPDPDKNISRHLNACIISPSTKYKEKTIAYHLAQTLGANRSNERISLMDQTKLNASPEIYFSMSEENAINETVRKMAY